MVYRDRMEDVQTLYHDGFTRFIESKRYLQVRKKYLEIHVNRVPDVVPFPYPVLSFVSSTARAIIRYTQLQH